MAPPKQSQRQSQESQTQLADLKFERRNQDMVKLPKYARVTKRPIPHAPISSPYTGASIPKIIYVSSSTPYMSAVKRVQKLLLQAEKRATTSLANKNNKNKYGGKNAPQKKLGEQTQTQQEQLIAAMARGEDREMLDKEEVFVKATGKAMQTALKVGRWFGSHGREEEYKVRVSTGAVLVVDDVEEDEMSKEGFLRSTEKNTKGKMTEAEAGIADVDVDMEAQGAASAHKGDDTTLMTTTTGTEAGDITIMTETEAGKSSEPTDAATKPNAEAKLLSKSALRKRKRAANMAASLAETELPETRTRWVNSVEVAVSLR
ncbi:ribonuclease P subunit p20 family protein [Aspergillus foveolatus]|uniref:ribonuclease P subunit p20 family protein n=1 Tax=Aspergillus foveolatus TaxID=210207 RepID=UPI003CCD4BAF